MIARRDHTHTSFQPPNGPDRRRSFMKVKRLKGIMLATNLEPSQRRVALLHKCQSELAAAKLEFAQIETREGDGFMEATEEAITEGGEGEGCK